MRTQAFQFFVGFCALTAPLHAQSTGFRLRGVRVEANAGGDRYSSSGTHSNKFGYGATVGVDAEFSRFVIGVEGSYWRDSKQPINCLTGDAGTFCNSAAREFGGAVRAGYEFAPGLLVFGKAGLVRDRQRNVFTSSGGDFIVDGQIVPGPPSTDMRFSESGYEVGGGLEYSLTSHFYADGQYVYSRYRNQTSRNRIMAGLGYRF